MSGWIKLRRTLTEWEWYDDHNATRLLIHLLCSVNYEDKKWKGILVKKGSLVYSWESLSDKVFMSVQQCRTAMNKLEKSQEVTRYSTSKYQVVTLVKWEKIQLLDSVDNKQPNNEVTSNQQGDNKQVTTTKERKEYKEDKEKVYDKITHDTLDLCLLCFDEHLKPKTESETNNWLDTIDKLIRLDNLPPDTIVDIVKKTRQDDFWQKNFLSITKLRKKNKDGVKYIVYFNEQFKNNKNGKQQQIQQLADAIRRENASI